MVFSWSLNRKVVLDEWWRIAVVFFIAHSMQWCKNLRTFIVQRL